MALYQAIDREILQAATAFGGTSPIRDGMVFVVADLTVVVFMISAVALFFSGKTKRRRERNQDSVLIALAGLLIAVGIRYLIISATSRPRPFVTYPELHRVDLLPVDPSAFPSGHALYLFTFAGTIFFLGYRKLGITLLVLAAAVAVARVMAGVHYPTDVIGGAVIGLGLAKLLSWQGSWVKRQVR